MIVRGIKGHGDNYGYSGLLFFVLAKGTWRALSISPITFSDQGCFYVDGDLLRVWDSVYAPPFEAHTAKHRFRLSKYLLTNGGPVLMGSRRTKREYSPGLAGGGWLTDRGFVAKENDPLREFNLKWKWWAPSEH